MSFMSVERVTCPQCGKLTVKGRFCMYCGKELESVSEPQAAPQIPSVEAPKPEEMAEERKLIEQLANIHKWRFKLIDVFLEGGTDIDIFEEVYREYHERGATLESKLQEEKVKIEERIGELTTKLNQLKVRHEVGEIPDRQYIMSKLEIDKELSKLRPKLGLLQNPFDVRLADLPAFEESIRSRVESIKSSGKKLNMSDELIELVINDLSKVLENVNVLMEQHRKIKHELNKLELRYKIGELKEDEYLAQKQRLEKQLEMQF
ncbi:MAG: hypothetical protein QXO01_03525 [Nitrososphaerota archaeon]